MDDTADAIAYQNVTLESVFKRTKNVTNRTEQEIDEMLSGLMSTEDEEEIMKELDDLREQEVKGSQVSIQKYRTKVVKRFFFVFLVECEIT